MNEIDKKISTQEFERQIGQTNDKIFELQNKDAVPVIIRRE